MSSYEKYLTEKLSQSSEFMEHTARQMGGMSAAELNLTGQALTAISRGRMPEGQTLRWLESQAKQNFGWDSKTTRAALGEVLSHGSPPQRIYEYLAAGGRQVSEQSFNAAMEFAQHYAREDLAASLTERMEAGKSNHAIGRDHFEGMPASKNALEHAGQRNSIRDMVSAHFPGVGEKTFEQRRAEVERARHRLADRLDADTQRAMRDAATGKETPAQSLRDAVRDSVDFERIRAASVDMGFGDVREDAERILEEDRHIDDRSIDITEDL